MRSDVDPVVMGGIGVAIVHVAPIFVVSDDAPVSNFSFFLEPFIELCDGFQVSASKVSTPVLILCS